jgi:hypothetical protein
MARKVIFKTDVIETQIAYLAGIIDGEGCFYIGHTKQGKYGSGYQWHSLLKITSCDECLILWLENTFGGSKDSRYRWTSKKAFTRPVFNWQASGEMLDFLLPKVKEFLVIKKPHCEVMIKYRSTSKNIGSKRLPDSVNESRVLLMQKMRNLNSRFHNHAAANSSALSP